jgi:hypothetical protein
VCRPVDVSIGFGLCTSGAGCDPVADTGCAAGLSCYFVVDAVSCYPSGSTAVGEPCTALTECVPGAMCVATPAGTRCRPTCRTTEDGCAEGERCVAFAPTTDWGACVAEWGSEP